MPTLVLVGRRSNQSNFSENLLKTYYDFLPIRPTTTYYDLVRATTTYYDFSAQKSRGQVLRKSKKFSRPYDQPTTYPTTSTYDLLRATTSYQELPRANTCYYDFSPYELLRQKSWMETGLKCSMLRSKIHFNSTVLDITFCCNSIPGHQFPLHKEFNSLAPGKFESNFKHLIFKQILVIDGWGISGEIALIWMSLDFTDDQSPLVQVMAWCRQATSHYLRQCWPRSLSPYDITRPQWVNPTFC